MKPPTGPDAQRARSAQKANAATTMEPKNAMTKNASDCIDCGQPADQHNEATDDHEWRCVCGHTWRGHGNGTDRPTTQAHAHMTEDDFNQPITRCPLCGDDTDDIHQHNEIAGH